MNKRIVSSILAMAMFTSSAIASEVFFESDVRPGPYMVFGNKADPDKNKNPKCFGQVKWNDGSFLQLIRDLEDSELYIFFRNTTWNISDAPGEYELRINFTKGNKTTGLTFQYTLVNKNTILVRNLRKERFIPLFMGNNKMSIIMPGSIENAEVDLTGSSNVIQEISKCVTFSATINLNPNSKPNNLPDDYAKGKINI